MKFDPERVRANARKADTDDLLDRVTVYRAEMEPEALEIIEEELHARKLTDVRIEQHGQRRAGEVLRAEDGQPLRCHFCHRPAVARGRRWFRVFFRLLPLLPRTANLCEVHQTDRDRRETTLRREGR